MRILIIALSFTALVFLASCQQNVPTFAEYVASYNKIYSNTEYTSRQTLYNQKVSQFTQLNTLYNMTSGVNNFTDWTTDELNRNTRHFIHRIARIQDQVQYNRNDPLRERQ